MPTLIGRTIGTGGDHVDFAAYKTWALANYPDLTANGGVVLELQFLDQEHIGPAGARMMDLSGFVTSAAGYFHLTAAAGTSFWDQSDLASLARRYYPNKGAALKHTVSGQAGLRIGQNYTRVSKLLLKATDSGTSGYGAIFIASNIGGVWIDRCIIEGYGNQSSFPGVIYSTGATASNPNIVSNCVVASLSTTAGTPVIHAGAGELLVYNTVIAAMGGATLNLGIKRDSGRVINRNCVHVNVTTPVGPTASTGSTEGSCVTNGPVSGYMTVPFSTATFRDVTQGTVGGLSQYDLRPAAGSGLIGAGTAPNATILAREAELMASDLDGVARPAGGNYDAGASEYVAPAVAPTFPGNIGPISATRGAAISSVNVSSQFSDPGDTLTYSALGTWPGGITINSTTGVIGGTTTAAAGTYSGLTVRATDSTSLSVDSNSFAITVAEDTTGPTLSGTLTIGTATATGAPLSWSAASDDVAVTGYEVSTDGGSTYPITLGVVTSYTLTGLSSTTTYQVRVRAFDAAGNRSAALAGSFTTAAPPDTTLPTLSGTLTIGTPTSTGAPLSWPAASDNVGILGYEVSTDGGSSYPLVLGNVTSYTLTGLSPSTAYQVRVRAIDTSGNKSTPPLSGSFTTATPTDTVIPTMTGSLVVGTPTTSGAPLSWTAASDNVGIQGYEISTDGGLSYPIVLSTVTSYTLTGLTPSTTYPLRIRAIDTSGNRSAPLSASLTTATPPDTTLPTLTGTLTIGTPTATGAPLSWPAATDNAGIQGYEVSTDGGATYPIVLGNVTNYTLTGLSANTLYQVRVRAVDTSGNKSTPPLSGSFTTAAASGGFATTVSLTLTSDGVTPLANLTGLSWAFFDQARPHLKVAPVAKGSTGTTNGGGIFSVSIAGTALAPGAVGWLDVTNGDGSVNASHLVFSGPVAVA